jgi:hypothetical protein
MGEEKSGKREGQETNKNGKSNDARRGKNGRKSCTDTRKIPRQSRGKLKAKIHMVFSGRDVRIIEPIGAKPSSLLTILNPHHLQNHVAVGI